MSLKTLSREGSLEGDKSSSFANFFLKYLKIDLNLRIIAYFFYRQQIPHISTDKRRLCLKKLFETKKKADYQKKLLLARWA